MALNRYFFPLSCGLVLLIFSSSVLPSSFAQNSVLSYKLWFITSNDNGCSINNQNALHYYETVTDQYLTKYGISHTSISSKCLRLTDIQNNSQPFEAAVNAVDLPIIVMDLVSGGINLQLSKNIEGLYEFKGGKQVIFFCACSPFIE